MLSTIKKKLFSINAGASTPALPYKVYTALLTQSGGNNSQVITSGDLTIGVTYQINNTDIEPPFTWDFTNVGAPDNNQGTYFVAIGTTPNNWGNGAGLTYNTGAPVATVLENTIGNIWFSYNGVGLYRINSEDLFNGIIPKITNITGIIESNSAHYVTVEKVDTTRLNLNSWLSDGSSNENDLLINTPIEIRVYN